MTLTQNNTKYKYISKLPILKGHRKPLGFFRWLPKGRKKHAFRGSLKIKGPQVLVYRRNNDKSSCRISVAGYFSVRAGCQPTEELWWSQERVTDRRMPQHSLVVTIGHNGFRTMRNCPRSLGFKWYVATSSQSLNEINNGRLRELWQRGHKLIQSAIFSCEAKYRVVFPNIPKITETDEGYSPSITLVLQRMFITQTDNFFLSLNQFKLLQTFV